MRQQTLERRTKLLKMSALGFTPAEIKKDLAKEFNVSERAITYDFQNMPRWIKQFQNLQEAATARVAFKNRFEYWFRQVSGHALLTNNENAKVGCYHVIAKLLELQAKLDGVYQTPIFTPSEIILSWAEKPEEILQ